METLTDQEYRIDWMSVGSRHSQDKDRILSIIDRMKWDYDFKGKEVAMMPGFAINQIIREMKMPKVSAVSYNCHELAPYGLYGIEANYKNAKIRLFVVDEGTACVPVCIFVWEK